MSNYWFVTLPSNPQDQGYSSLKKTLASDDSSPTQSVPIPEFIVGNLDSLISLSDELSKSNTTVENVLRKIERQYLDISAALASVSASGQGSEKLRINGCEVEKYLHDFKWDPATFPYHGKPLQELCNTILSMATRVDDELKRTSVSYTEKSQNIAALQRRKTVNMTTSDFEDFLKPEDVAKCHITQLSNSEYVQPLMVIVPKALDEQFSKEYVGIGDKIGCGGAKWTGNESRIGTTNDSHFARSNTHFSPVVPGSLKLVYDDEKMDSKLYMICSLKGHYTSGDFETVDGVKTFKEGTFTDYIKPLKDIFREHKYTVREFSYNTEISKGGGLDALISIAKKELEEAQKSLSKWCTTNFSQVYSGWVHLKVIKAYSESVLRYGLPCSNATLSMFIVKPDGAKEKQIKDRMVALVSKLRPHLVPKKSALEEDEEEDLETLPFVCQKFVGIGC